MPPPLLLQQTINMSQLISCSHCTENLHLARRQEFFGGGTESMEQSSRHTAKTEQ